MRAVHLAALLGIACAPNLVLAAEPWVIGLSYPSTGSHKWEGVSQMRGALLAVDEINATGGVLGRPLKLVSRNSGGQVEVAVDNVNQLAAQGAVMLMGGASSDEVIAAGAQARKLRLPYFVPMAYADRVTGREGQPNLFREGASARMASNVLMEYLETTYPGKRYFIITSDDVITNGRSGSLATLSHATEGFGLKYHRDALTQAAGSDADILVLMLYGTDVVNAMRMVGELRLKERMLVVVPNLNQDLVEQAGPALMAGVLGSDTWTWQVPKQVGNARGEKFVADYIRHYQAYPSSAAASAYDVLYQWRDAVSRAGTVDTVALIPALEEHSYSLLKDSQKWRALDHQNVQSMYVVKVKPREEVLKDPLKQDYFEILYSMDGDIAVPSPKQVLWERSPEGAN
ncbi:ABC transporter substrate-binding protein [Pseudomonas nitroreducens]|uniref:ABC transporter substrate-binding protein n=1 Tax=Pseudomonas nitroreducens TaxID=46680 RepID=UPI003CC832A8